MSPAYVLENPNGNTLCIPTVFISMTGEALDHKTPVLRSQQAMAVHAERVLELFGHDDPDNVVAYCGPEQEYFLVDSHFFLARPDLLNAGRTLFGAKPPKGQEFDDHYFGAIPERVLGFMMDTERELFKLGIPAKTRHNEVAPGQFEVAPMFERANEASDHQQLLMTTFKAVAKKHGMECLFHEKPFDGRQRLGQARELLARQLRARQPARARRHPARQRPVPGLLRRGHPRGAPVRRAAARLGRLGEQRPPARRQRGAAGDHLDLPRRPARRRLRPDRQGRRHPLQGEGHADHRRRHAAQPHQGPGRPQPHQPVRLHRQPLRVPRAGLHPDGGRPMVVLNTIMAEALDHCATDARGPRSPPAPTSTRPSRRCSTEIITDHGAVIFNGNGYSDEWPIEAEQRGLKNLRTTVDALPELISPEAIELFAKYGVFNEREMHSRYEIGFEQYVLTVAVEANLTLEIGTTTILPAAMRYQTELATNVAALKAAGVEADPSDARAVCAPSPR